MKAVQLDFPIPHVDLTEEEKQSTEAIMRRGNRVLQTYQERIIAKTGNKRYSKRKLRAALFSAIKAGGPVKILGIGFSTADISLILAVRKIETKVIGGYVKLITQLAARWSRRCSSSSMSIEDFLSEGYMAAMDAVYGFRKDGIRFTTYLQWAVQRRFMYVLNTSKPFSPWTGTNQKLFGEFAEKQMEVGTEVGFRQIVKLMKLSEREIYDLQCMLTQVATQSVLEGSGPSSGLRSEVGIYAAPTKDNESTDGIEFLDAVEMSDWERTVLNAYLTDGRGWATRVAEENINPVTGIPYSRRAPWMVLDRVLNRIKLTMGNEVADAA